MKQSRRSTKFVFQGLSELVKFGKFVETEGVQASNTQIVIVVEEHVALARSNLSSSFEVVDDSDDDDTNDDVDDSDDDGTNDDVDNHDDDDSDSDDDGMDFLMYSNDLTPEQIDVLIAQLQSTVRKPPQAVPVISDSPSESDKIDSNASLAPTKRRHKDPSLGVLSTEPQGGDEDSHQTVSELKQEIMLVKREYIKKDFLIGSLDVRVSTLEHENSVKDAKIYELQANLGGITALFFDLNQCLHQKFGEDFQPLSVEGEKISVCSSDPVNPPSQDVSERVVRLAPDANLGIIFWYFFFLRKKRETSSN
ncbi:uncharacterized protein LOC111915038 [Lactuca sativa]|uniref:uncharacterized protein LOC111915038 n=1 Tax=Lactuca sativa TaxID=4236 RepID=UPI000CD852BA|nr:uncharacterized protein LOC111915038 [Lactuca sativa]